MKKLIQILGATGSIGENTLSLVREHRDEFQVLTLTAHNNYNKLAELALEFLPEDVVINNQNHFGALKELLSGTNIRVHAGSDALNQVVSKNCDVTISGIVGIAALTPTMHALKGTKLIGLANKESIVCAGDMMMRSADNYGCKIIPVDSEHSGIFQILDKAHKIRSVVITASGGPFFNSSLDFMRTVTPEMAVKHPTWKMGGKISVDSATLANKGLEVIEAARLFGLSKDALEVTVHPQSIVHAIVNYIDGSSLAQLSHPTMRTPVAYAMFYPARKPIEHRPLHLAELSNLDFFEPDYNKFPLLKLAFDLLDEPSCYSIAFNAANEAAVMAFLQNKIKFLDINTVVFEVVENFIEVSPLNSIEEVFDINKLAFDMAQNKIATIMH